VLQESQDREEIIERVAALDVGKAEVVCCVRVPHEDRPGRRLQEVETYSTMTRSLQGLADHLACLGVTRVVMEATSDYWRPVFYVLEAPGSRRGWSTLMRSSICRAARRPTGWTRCGCARSPNGR
jgi:transposase